MSDLKICSGDGSVTLGMYFDGRDTKVHNVYETQDGLDMLNLTRKFYQAGYIRKDASLENTKHNDNIRNGTVFCTPSLLKPGKDGEMSNPKITFVQKGLQDTYMYDAMGAMVSLSKTSQDPERCMMFLNMLYQSKELTNLIHYGIEGKDYTKKSDNVIEPIKDNGWQLNKQWAIGNQFIQYLTSTDDPQKFKKIEQMNKEAKACPFNGFTFNKDSLTAEYAAVVNATKQFRSALNVGAIDPEENISKILDAQKKAGIDKIKNEMQKQFDAFAASKK
jgi:putative aldouronate transport system substrate-binding protein